MTVSPSSAPAAPTDGSTGTRDRRLLLGAVGVAAAVAVGGFVFLGGGDDAVDSSSSVVRNSPAVTKTQKAATTAAGSRPAAKPATLPRPSTVTAGRNPFKALYLAPAAGTGGAATGQAPTPVTPLTPIAPAVPITPPTTPVVIPVAPAEEKPAAYTLRLDKVVGTDYRARSTFTYGGKPITVIQGQRFGVYGELVVLNFGKRPGTATLDVLVQVGDGAPFAMRVGQTRQVL